MNCGKKCVHFGTGLYLEHEPEMDLTGKINAAAHGWHMAELCRLKRFKKKYSMGIVIMPNLWGFNL